MDRLGCVEVPALSLQLLLRAHPDWRSQPVAIVDREAPQGVLLQVNENARRAGVLPGLRYAQSLSLCGGLRAGVVADAELLQGVATVLALLQRFSPVVEPHASGGQSGAFWLDASGLGRLFASASAWARAIRQALVQAQFTAAVVVGFTRFGTGAVARALASRSTQTQGGVLVFADPAREQATVARVPLDRLDLEPQARDALAQLGVRTVAQFLRLPAAGLARRFGDTALALHRLANGRGATPLTPFHAPAPPSARLDLDLPDDNWTSVLFMLRQMCEPLAAALVRDRQAIAEVEIELGLERGAALREAIRPATPTLDVVQLFELIRLRLEATPLPAGVVSLALTLRGADVARAQGELFAAQPRRDLVAGNRALARLRAAFGEAAVARATLRDGHLPEAGFCFESITALALPAPRVVACRTLVRRVEARPQPLGRATPDPTDGWMLRGPRSGPVVRLSGPYRVSGGWWRVAIERDYHFAEMKSGEVLWAFFDRRRRRWFLQGTVE